MGENLPALYAASNAQTQRKFLEDQTYEFPFQEDRNRVLRCSAFRRLDFKTQVFVPHDHDHFRTRLTHSLEVAQVGRDAARLLGLNEDLTEAVALAHDLGHPPFGHSGEDTLDELMGDFGGFEHNSQSLRIVDYLKPYECYPPLHCRPRKSQWEHQRRICYNPASSIRRTNRRPL